mgnify:CR=1 FL=1
MNLTVMKTNPKTIHDDLNQLAQNLYYRPGSAFKRAVMWRACDLISDHCIWRRMADSEPEWGVPVLARYTDDGDDEMPVVAWSDARDGSWGDRVPLYWLYIPPLQPQTQNQTQNQTQTQ